MKHLGHFTWSGGVAVVMIALVGCDASSPSGGTKNTTPAATPAATPPTCSHTCLEPAAVDAGMDAGVDAGMDEGRDAQCHTTLCP